MPDLHSGNIITLSRLASWASLVPGHTKQQQQHGGDNLPERPPWSRTKSPGLTLAHWHANRTQTQRSQVLVHHDHVKLYVRVHACIRASTHQVRATCLFAPSPALWEGTHPSSPIATAERTPTRRNAYILGVRSRPQAAQRTPSECLARSCISLLLLLLLRPQTKTQTQTRLQVIGSPRPDGREKPASGRHDCLIVRWECGSVPSIARREGEIVRNAPGWTQLSQTRARDDS